MPSATATAGGQPTIQLSLSGLPTPRVLSSQSVSVRAFSSIRTATMSGTTMHMTDLSHSSAMHTGRPVASDRNRLVLSRHRIMALRSRLCRRNISPSGA